EPGWFFRIAAGSRLPFEQAAAIVQPSDGIDVGYEFVLVRKWPCKLDLQIAARLANPNAILLAEAVEQLNALLEHAIPAIAMRVLELLILIELPFLKQGSRCVLLEKEGGQSAFKGATKEHGCPGVFLLPAIEIAMTVAAWAGQVLAYLGVAVH